MQTTETDSLQLSSGELDDGMLPRLTVVRHPDPSLVGVGQCITKGPRLTLGRSGAVLPGVLDHKRVSREHATLRIDQDRLRVVDLGSRNGTRVNDERVDESRALDDGDIIGIGPVLLLAHRGPRQVDDVEHPLLWGVSHQIASLVASIGRIGPLADNVAIRGETGVGKELVAAALHACRDPRGPYLSINCATVHDGVVSSELYGHVRGAFSGADVARVGLLASAHGGTLFLDEVTSASPQLQAALLRVLEDRRVRPVGGTEDREVNVRFVSAVQDGGAERPPLRDDLWFRLATQQLHVPSLRERRVDIPYLAQRFAAERLGEPVRLGRRLGLAVLRYDWPGNVRELRAIVNQLIVEYPPERRDETLELEAPADAVLRLSPPGTTAPSVGGHHRGKPATRPSREVIDQALRIEHGRVSDAARRLGVARKTLYRWVHAYAITLESYR